VPRLGGICVCVLLWVICSRQRATRRGEGAGVFVPQLLGVVLFLVYLSLLGYSTRRTPCTLYGNIWSSRTRGDRQ